MSLESCYAAMGGDLEGVRGRLLTDERIRKFAAIFLEDKSFENLGASLEEGNLAEAFRAAHTMKGSRRCSRPQARCLTPCVSMTPAFRPT